MSSFDSNPAQATEDWIAAKVGKLSASLAAAAFARSKKDGKPLQAWHDLVDNLVAERITGQLTSNFVTAAMKWGTDHEAEARDAYMARTGNTVDLCGFIDHPTIPMFGCSPDGLIGTDGLLEIKCPYNPAIHFRRMAGNVMPAEYEPQVLFQLVVTGRSWVDYADFYPLADDNPNKRLELWVYRYVPTKEKLKQAEMMAREVLTAVQEKTSLIIGAK